MAPACWCPGSRRWPCSHWEESRSQVWVPPQVLTTVLVVSPTVHRHLPRTEVSCAQCRHGDGQEKQHHQLVYHTPVLRGCSPAPPEPAQPTIAGPGRGLGVSGDPGECPTSLGVRPVNGHGDRLGASSQHLLRLFRSIACHAGHFWKFVNSVAPSGVAQPPQSAGIILRWLWVALPRAEEPQPASSLRSRWGEADGEMPGCWVTGARVGESSLGHRCDWGWQLQVKANPGGSKGVFGHPRRLREVSSSLTETCDSVCSLPTAKGYPTKDDTRGRGPGPTRGRGPGTTRGWGGGASISTRAPRASAPIGCG